MPKGSFFLAKVEEEYARKLEQVRREYEQKLEMERHFSRVFQLDMVTLALGRMGFGEKRFRAFDKMLSEVQSEFVDSVHEDMKDDPDVWYSKGKLDQELKQYTGKFFVPFDRRYAWGEYTDGEEVTK